ncbi:hypothetical protein ABTM81_20540, partial [Acinetobacter baumannii]
LLLGSTFLRYTPESSKVSELEVRKNMLLKGDVDHFDLVKNKEVVRVYIKQDSIVKPYYEERFKKKFEPASVKGVPLFQF